MGFIEGGGKPEPDQREELTWMGRAGQWLKDMLVWWKLTLLALPTTLPFHLQRLFVGRSIYVLLARQARHRPETVEGNWIEKYGLRQFQQRYKLARSILTQLALGGRGLSEETTNNLLRQGAKSGRAAQQDGQMEGPLRPRKLGETHPNPNPDIDGVQPPFQKHPEAFADLLNIYLMSRSKRELRGVKFEADPALLRVAAKQPQAHHRWRVKQFFRREGDWPNLQHFVLGAAPEDFHEAVCLLVERLQNGDNFTYRKDRKTLSTVLQRANPKQLQALDPTILLTNTDAQIREMGLRAVGKTKPSHQIATGNTATRAAVEKRS